MSGENGTGSNNHPTITSSAGHIYGIMEGLNQRSKQHRHNSSDERHNIDMSKMLRHVHH